MRVCACVRMCARVCVRISACSVCVRMRVSACVYVRVFVFVTKIQVLWTLIQLILGGVTFFGGTLIQLNLKGGTFW